MPSKRLGRAFLWLSKENFHAGQEHWIKFTIADKANTKISTNDIVWAREYSTQGTRQQSLTQLSKSVGKATENALKERFEKFAEE
ncbi:hypothetical protein LTR67_009365 [Exophiala xenobiotica]|jgi:hypothetical protein